MTTETFQETFNRELSRRRVVDIVAENAKDELADDTPEAGCKDSKTASPTGVLKKLASRLSSPTDKGAKAKKKAAPKKTASKTVSKKSAAR